MLIISRKKDEKIIVADDIEITILEVGRNRVRFGIKAPKSVTIQTRLKAAPEQSEAVEAPKPESAQQQLPADSTPSQSS